MIDEDTMVYRCSIALVLLANMLAAAMLGVQFDELAFITGPWVQLGVVCCLVSCLALGATLRKG